MSNEEHIENVINRTFEIIKKVYDYQQEKEGLNQQEKEGLKQQDNGSRIIFPKKRKKQETRLSEQELRFIFVEQLNKEIDGESGEKWDVYYSVETPTKDRYYFKDIPPHRCDETDTQGQSANFDLVVYDSKFKRIALMEFKANNPDIHDYQKDLCKLTNDNEVGEYRYFIQLLENTQKGKNEKTDTIENIKRKCSPQEGDWKKYWGTKEVLYRCYSLEKGNREFNKEDVIREGIQKK